MPTFSFAIATMNPVELGQGTFPLSEAATDRFAIMINIGYLPPRKKKKLVHFDFKRVRLNALMTKERIIELRGAINEQVFLHERLAGYIQQLVAATRPYNPDTDWHIALAVGAGRARRRPRRFAARASSAGHAWPRSGRCSCASAPRSTGGHPGSRARTCCGHRIWLGPHAASHGLTTDCGDRGRDRESAHSVTTIQSHENAKNLCKRGFVISRFRGGRSRFRGR